MEKLHLLYIKHDFSQEFRRPSLCWLMNYYFITAPPQTFSVFYAAYFPFTNPHPPLWRIQTLNLLTKLCFELISKCDLSQIPYLQYLL